MGQLINGQWVSSSVITSNENGSFVRKESQFRNLISDDSYYKAESNRYHLYASYACPWAHRVLIMRELKQLEKHVTLDIVHPDMLENGWSFDKNYSKADGDSLYNKKFLYEIYQKHEKKITSKVTVPILWDKKTHSIVNNESSEILRIFNSAFNKLTGNYKNFYPKKYRKDIDKINEEVYVNINNGVYKTGFARSQTAYDDSVYKLFKSLNDIDSMLLNKNFLIANKLTEADIRLVTTLLRFDSVYHYHFKCNLKKNIRF